MQEFLVSLSSNWNSPAVLHFAIFAINASTLLIVSIFYTIVVAVVKGFQVIVPVPTVIASQCAHWHGNLLKLVGIWDCHVASLLAMTTKKWGSLTRPPLMKLFFLRRQQNRPLVPVSSCPQRDACWYVSFLILQAQQWVINAGYSCVSNNTGAFLYADLFPNP